jgi:hypothetical protein
VKTCADPQLLQAIIRYGGAMSTIVDMSIRGEVDAFGHG